MSSLSRTCHPDSPALLWQGVVFSVLLHLVAIVALKGLAPLDHPEPARLLSVALAEPAAPPRAAPPRPSAPPTATRAAATHPHARQIPSALAADTPQASSPALLPAAETALSVAANSYLPTAAPPAPTTAPAATPAADSAWLSKTILQLMNARKHYPRGALRLGLEGQVLIEATLNGRGEVVSARVLESAGAEILDQDALALLRAVTPLKVDQVLAPLTRVRVPVRYALEE